MDRARRTDEVRLHLGSHAKRQLGLLATADLATYDRLPVTTAARTIVDLAARLDDATVERLVDDSLVRCVTTVPLLSGCLSRNSVQGRTGSGAVRSALALWERGTMQSHAEVVVARWLRRMGFPTPVAQMVVPQPNGRHWRVDFGRPEFRVVLEVDSFEHHHGPRKLSRDHERRSGIEAEGWRVLSTTVAEIERGGHALKAALTLWNDETRSGARRPLQWISNPEVRCPGAGALECERGRRHRWGRGSGRCHLAPRRSPSG
jgi:very-short-patch-repair endonuclease